MLYFFAEAIVSTDALHNAAPALPLGTGGGNPRSAERSASAEVLTLSTSATSDPRGATRGLLYGAKRQGAEQSGGGGSEKAPETACVV